MKSQRRALGRIFLAGVVCLFAAAAAAQTSPTTVTVQLSGSNNDAEQVYTGGVTLGNPSLNLGQSHIIAGLRFTNVNIPKGVKIDSAYIEFEALMNDTGAAEILVKAQAADNGREFSANDFDLSARPVFDTSVSWRITEAWTNGMAPKPRTPELATVVQEITDLSSWDSGDSMVFIFSANSLVSRWVGSYESGAAKAARLTITYSVYKLEVQTSATTVSDDLFQARSSTSNTITNGDNVQLGTTTSGLVVCAGLRFQDVNLPPNVEITEAYIKFRAHESASQYSTRSITIQGEKVLGPKTYATSASPSTNPDLPINRKANSPLTTSQVVWNPIAGWTINGIYTTPSLKAVIQELVNQPGWQDYRPDSYKAISLFLSGNDVRKICSSSCTHGYAPRLYIEYRFSDGVGQPRMSIAPEHLSVSRSCAQGQPVMSSQVKLANIGTGALSLTAAVTYEKGSGWLNVVPVGTGTLRVESGVEQMIYLSYQTNLPTGEYKATVRLADPNSLPTSYDIAVTLVVNPPSDGCPDIPIYIKDTAQPAVLVLLDLSDSMGKYADFTEGLTLPQTPNLRDLVARVVSKADWAPGNSMVFNLRRESGAPLCKARAYDGSTASSPMLEISYFDASGIEKTVKVRVRGGLEDGYVSDTSWMTSEPEIELGGQNAYGLFLRFSNIDVPQNVYITDARIVFVPTNTAYGDLLLRVRIQDSGAPAAFVSGTTPTMDTTGRTWYPAGVLSTGVGWTPGAWTAVFSRLKIDMAKEAILQLIQDQRVSWGYGTWAQHANWQAAGENPLTYTRVHVGCKAWDPTHYSDLKTAIEGTNVAGSMTPFAPSLLGAEKYFSGQKAAENGGVYAETSCQPKILINVSDGNGNIDSTEEQVGDRAKALAAAGISAAGIGFVLPADEGTCLRKLAVVSNQEADANVMDSVFALHPVQGGTPQYYNAGNERELIAVFESILMSFRRANFFSAAPATTSLQYKDRLLLGSWSSLNFRGDLLSVQRNANGEFGEVEWSAYENMTARSSPRKVFTVDTSAVTLPVIPFNDENVLCLKIGPIINSAPTVAGPPPFYYNYDDYRSFAYARGISNPRVPQVYVGANDGLIHAFKLEDGSESWAFMPPSMQSRLAGKLLCDATNPTACNLYFMDATPKLADVRAKISGQDQWRTLLIAGQRQGGTAYTALDVTSGKPFDDLSEPAQFLWEYPRPGQTDDDLGETWAEPEVERVKDGTGAAWAAFFTSGYAANDAQQAGKQAYLYALDAYTGQAIWAGGANKIGLGFTGNYKTDYVNYTSSADHVQPERVLSTGGTVVLHRNWDWWQGDNSAHSCTFSIDRAVSDAANRSGTLYFKADSLKSPKSPNPDCWEPDFPTTYMSVLDKVPYASLAQAGWFAKPVPTALANNALNSPLAVDMDGDNMAEVLYTGDLYGNLYRVTNIGKGETPVSSLLFRFDPVPANPGPYAIRGKATVARSSVKDTVWVYFGTGRYETWDDKSAPGTNPQFFFGLKETKIPANGTPPAPYVHAYGGGTSTRQPVLRACQTQVTAHGQKLRLVTGDPNNDDSWGLRLGFGDGNERTFTKPLVVGGIVFFTTFVPDRNSCGGGGESFVFALDYATGLPTTFAVFDLDGDGKFTDADKVEVTQADGSKVKVAPAGISIGRGVGSAPVLFKNTLYVTTTAPIIGDIEAGGGNIGGLHALDVNIPQNRVSLESWKHN